MIRPAPGDISQPGVGQRIVDAALQRFGQIDTVVNYAGIFVAKPFTDYTDDEFDAVTGVNLRGFFEVSRAAIAACCRKATAGTSSISRQALSTMPIHVCQRRWRR